MTEDFTMFQLLKDMRGVKARRWFTPAQNTTHGRDEERKFHHGHDNLRASRNDPTSNVNAFTLQKVEGRQDRASDNHSTALCKSDS